MKKKVALVLSGGGARGIAHIGVIEELERQGYEISSIAGTSMGAVVGGIYALGKLEEYKSWLFTLDRLKVFRLVDFTFSGQGLIKGDKVFHTMQEFIADANIEDLPIPFAAVAADLPKRKEVVFTKGSMYDALRASVAIPTVLTPVSIEEGLLVDGGVINNLPLNHVRRMEGDLLVAVYVNAAIPVDRPKVTREAQEEEESAYQKKMWDFYQQLRHILPLHEDKEEAHKEKMGFFDLINETLSFMTDHNVQVALEQYPPDVLVQLSYEACGTFDFYKAREMVEMGRYAARKALKQ